MRKTRVPKRVSLKRVLRQSHIAQAVRQTLRKPHRPWRSMAGLAAAGLLAMSTPVLAAFPPEINVSDLDGSDGFVINGIDEDDHSGDSVSAAGDVNGDGIDDFIIGAAGADPNGNYNAGESYVVFGRTGGFPAAFNLSDLDGSNGFVINGIDAGDGSGRRVSAAGDVNGDGIDDVIIGAFYADPNGIDDAGESYVIFGQTTGFPAALNLSDLDGSNGFVINGIDAGDRSGFSVSGAGDVNGDGIGDVIIGAFDADPNGIDDAGESYVVFGRTGGFPAALNLSDLDGSNGFVINGIDAGDRSGFSVSGAGDVNGDGIDDVIIGAVGANPFGIDGARESYVIFGQTTGFPAALNLSDLDGSNGFVINSPDRVYTETVSAAGDVNGDGIDDFIVGSGGGRISADQNTYVVFGRTTGFPAAINLSDLDGSNGFVIIESSGGQAAGDVNGDGIDDFIVADHTTYGSNQYVVFGRTTGFPPDLGVGELDVVITGSSSNDGQAAGDVNGDGIADIITGNNSAHPNGIKEAGESYVVFGRGDAVPKINDYVTFEPDSSTYTFTPNTSGCPNGFVGKFGFEAQLNNASQATLSDLDVQVAELSNGNLLLISDGTIGVGGVFPVPKADDYSDGFLTPGEYVDVPFYVCLITPDPFRFFVDVLGVVEGQ